ncbi:MAG TPA: hypothetical protein VLC93_05315 [Myxococcota bacterium]|nr:hypothetical protein [Myxococcota bacterium]
MRVRRSTATPRQITHLCMQLVARLERSLPSLLARGYNSAETMIAGTPVEYATVITLFTPNALRQEADKIGAYDQPTRIAISRRVEAAFDRLVRGAHLEVLAHEYYPDGTLARVALAP